MPDPQLYLQAMLTAAIASAISVLAMASLKRSAGMTWLNSACVVGIGVGLSAGYHVLALRLTWPPVSGLNRFLTIVIPAAVAIELAAGFESVPHWFAWSLRLGLAATIPRILLHNSVYLSDSDFTWPLWQASLILVGCGVLVAALWSLLTWLNQRSSGVSIPLALSLTIQCAGITIMLAGYIKGGAAAFPLAATLAATTGGTWLISKRSGTSPRICNPAIIGIGVVGLSGLLLIGRFFGELSTTSALTMLLAPLLCWVTETPWLRNRKPWLVGLIRLVLVAIPLLWVLAEAKSDFDRDMAPLLTHASVAASGF
jgi:hypothetical protein